MTQSILILPAAIFASIFAVVFSCILIAPDMIFERYRLAIDKLPLWAFKALGGCSVCFSGQLAMWSYLVSQYDDYSIINHIAYIVLTIFFTDIITKEYHS